MEMGLLEEVESLMDKGLTSKDYPMKGIGYKELIAHLDNPEEITLEEAVDEVKKNTRHYAKRQFTWFKRYTDMEWFDLTGIDSMEEDYHNKIEEIEEWLKTQLAKKQ